MFNNAKELRKELSEKTEENEELNRENEELKLLLMEEKKQVTQLAIEIPLYCTKMVDIRKEKEKILAVLKKITQRATKEEMTLYREEFQKDGHFVEHWYIPEIPPMVGLLSEALEWWIKKGKKEWKGEVQKIYCQPKVGWIIVRRYKKDIYSTPTL